MTRTADANGSHADNLSAGAGRLLAFRLMRAPLATPDMSHWTYGANHWLLDVLAPDPRSTATVISNFRQLVPDGRMKIHAGILLQLDPDTLKRWASSQSAEGGYVSTADVMSSGSRRG